MSFESALQTAVYERLSSYPGMLPVYDDVPEDAPENYVTIGEDTHVPFDTDDSVGSESTITIHVWCKGYRGKAKTKEIQGLIYQALNRYDLVVDGFHTVTVEFEYSDVLLDPDGLTRHGVQRFRTLLEETAAS